MSKRLQVLMDETEYRRIRQIARDQGISLAEWVRQVLRAASREVPSEDRDEKLAVIRAAARHSFPTADIDEMLAQIDQGYL